MATERLVTYLTDKLNALFAPGEIPFDPYMPIYDAAISDYHNLAFLKRYNGAKELFERKRAYCEGHLMKHSVGVATLKMSGFTIHGFPAILPLLSPPVIAALFSEVINELRTLPTGESGITVGSSVCIFGCSLAPFIFDQPTAFPRIELSHLFIIEGVTHDRNTAVLAENIIADVTKIGTYSTEGAPMTSMLGLRVGSNTYTASHISSDHQKVAKAVSEALIKHMSVSTSALVWLTAEKLPRVWTDSCSFSKYTPLLVEKTYTGLSLCPREAFSVLKLNPLPHSIGSAVWVTEYEAALFVSMYADVSVSLALSEDPLLVYRAMGSARAQASLKGLNGMAFKPIPSLFGAASRVTSPPAPGRAAGSPTTDTIFILCLAAITADKPALAATLAALTPPPAMVIAPLARAVPLTRMSSQMGEFVKTWAGADGAVVATINDFLLGPIGRVGVGCAGWEISIVQHIADSVVGDDSNAVIDGHLRLDLMLRHWIATTSHIAGPRVKSVVDWVRSTSAIPSPFREITITGDALVNCIVPLEPAKWQVTLALVNDRKHETVQSTAHYMKELRLERFVKDAVATTRKLDSDPEIDLDSTIPHLIGLMALEYSAAVAQGDIAISTAHASDSLPMDRADRLLGGRTLPWFKPASEVQSTVHIRHPDRVIEVMVHGADQTSHLCDLLWTSWGIIGDDLPTGYGDAIVCCTPGVLAYPAFPPVIRMLCDMLPSVLIMTERANFSAMAIDPISAGTLLERLKLFRIKPTKTLRRMPARHLAECGAPITPAHFPGRVDLYEFITLSTNVTELGQRVAERILDILEDESIGVHELRIGEETIAPSSIAHQSVILGRHMAQVIEARVSPQLVGAAVCTKGIPLPFRLTFIVALTATVVDEDGLAIDMDDDVGDWDGDDDDVPAMADIRAVTVTEHSDTICYPDHFSCVLGSYYLANGPPPTPPAPPPSQSWLSELLALISMLRLIEALIPVARFDTAPLLAIAGHMAGGLALGRWVGLIGDVAACCEAAAQDVTGRAVVVGRGLAVLEAVLDDVDRLADHADLEGDDTDTDTDNEDDDEGDCDEEDGEDSHTQPDPTPAQPTEFQPSGETTTPADPPHPNPATDNVDLSGGYYIPDDMLEDTLDETDTDGVTPRPGQGAGRWGALRGAVPKPLAFGEL